MCCRYSEWLMKEEKGIRARLQKVMPGYCADAVKAGDEVKKLWKQLTE